MSNKPIKTQLLGDIVQLLMDAGPLRHQDIAHKLPVAEDDAALAVHLRLMLDRGLLRKAHGLYYLIDAQAPVNGAAVGEGLEGALAQAVESAEQALRAYLKQDDPVASELFAAYASARRALARYRDRDAVPLFLRKQAD